MVKKAAKVPDAAPARLNILENAVLVSLRFNNLGNSAKLSSEKVDTDADKDQLRVSKRLLDSPEYRAILNHRWLWRYERLGSQAIVSPVSGTAVMVLPLALLSQVERMNAEDEAKDCELVKAFCAVYPARVEEAKAHLKGEWRAEDYPPVARVRAAFRVRLSYLTLGTPESLKLVSAAVYAREQKKFYESLEETAKEIRAVLREGLAELVGWMAARLSDREDGKKKAFGKPFDSKLERMRDFLDTFQHRNLTGDSELEPLVEKAKALLRGVDAEAVKEEGYRQRVCAGFSAVKAVLDTMVEAKPSRRIVLDD